MSYTSLFRGMFSSLGLAALAACTSVPITSYPKLATADPETMDMRQIEIAVRMQDDFGIIEDSVVIEVSFVHEETGEKIQEKFVLDENPEPLTPALTNKLKPGFEIHRYSMGAETGEAAMAYRTRMLAMRDAEAGDQHEGTFSASAGLCREVGGNPFIDPKMTLLIRFSPDQDFFTMFKETKMPIPRDETGQQTSCSDKG